MTHLLEQLPDGGGLPIGVHDDGGALVSGAPRAAAAVEEALRVLGVGREG